MFKKVTYTTNIVSLQSAFAAHVNIRCGGKKRIHCTSCYFYTNKLIHCNYAMQFSPYENVMIELFNNTDFSRDIVFLNGSRFATYQYNISDFSLSEDNNFVIIGHEKFEPIKMVLAVKNEQYIINIDRPTLVK